MTSKSPEPGFLGDSGYRELQRWYRESPIALYTGAGVSSARKPQKQKGEGPKYGLSGWDDFLGEILSALPKAPEHWLKEFKADITIRYRNRPWKIADWIVRRVGKDEFKTLVVKFVQRLDNFPDPPKSRSESKQNGKKSKKYKQLGGPFLHAAPTLNALCAFCSQLTGVVKGARKNTYRVSPNPRVRAVVTTNYDPFLEAASSTMFIRHRLKPVGARGSVVGNLHQIPVFHVHGYVPYPERGQRKKRRAIVPMVDPVITTDNYEKAWRPDSPFSFTMGPQVHMLRHYCTLFVGFSFRDAWVNQLLRRLKKEREKHDRPFSHYTLMKRSEIEAKGRNFFDHLGVTPIALDCYNQIPECLGRLYQEGLKADHGAGDIQLPFVLKAQVPKADVPGERGTTEAKPAETQLGPSGEEPLRLNPERYWEELCACRNCYVKQD